MPWTSLKIIQIFIGENHASHYEESLNGSPTIFGLAHYSRTLRFCAACDHDPVSLDLCGDQVQQDQNCETAPRYARQVPRLQRAGAARCSGLQALWLQAHTSVVVGWLLFKPLKP